MGLRQKNTYDLSGEYGIGWTSNTNKEFYFDLEDYDKIKDYCWYETSNGARYNYLAAKNKETNKRIKMHQLLGFSGYDHINRNPMDNRKGNLRQATRQENNRNHVIGKNNSSGIIGVRFDENRNKWVAGIAINGKWTQIGRFDNKFDAIIARLKAEQEYYQDFAPQRHLFDMYDIQFPCGGCL